MKLVVVCTCCLMTLLGAGETDNQSWYDQKLEGWYYFEDSKQANQDQSDPITPQQAEETITSEKRFLKQLLSLALLRPTEENVQNYMKRQKLWIDQSSRFAGMWGTALLENPLLGVLLPNPTTSYGLQVKKKVDLEKRKALLSSLSDEHFLVLFYKGEDPFAEAAGEVARLFGDANGWNVKGISLDGKLLANLNSEVDKGISHRFGVDTGNVFYVADPFAGRFVPVGAGLISVTQLEENIFSQFNSEVADD